MRCTPSILAAPERCANVRTQRRRKDAQNRAIGLRWGPGHVVALSRRAVELPPERGALPAREPDPSYFEREAELLGELESVAEPILRDLSLDASRRGGVNAESG